MIHYEPHPVSAERKAELRAKGLTIVDAKFRPDDRKVRDGADLPSREDIAVMPKSEVVEWLQAHGVEAPNGKIGELREVLIKMLFVDI